MLYLTLLLGASWCLTCGIIMLLCPETENTTKQHITLIKLSDQVKQLLSEYKNNRHDYVKALSNDYARNPRAFTMETPVTLQTWYETNLNLDKKILDIMPKIDDLLLIDPLISTSNSTVIRKYALISGIIFAILVNIFFITF